jgi:hypothetical protein
LVTAEGNTEGIVAPSMVSVNAMFVAVGMREYEMRFAIAGSNSLHDSLVFPRTSIDTLRDSFVSDSPDTCVMFVIQTIP